MVRGREKPGPRRGLAAPGGPQAEETWSEEGKNLIPGGRRKGDLQSAGRRIQGYKATRLQGSNLATRLQGYKATKLQDFASQPGGP